MLAPVKSIGQDINRLRQISVVLTSHGFTAVVRGAGLGRYLADAPEEGAEFEASGGFLGEDRSEAAVRFRKVLEDLGPTFVKAGQILSTRPDILPAEFIEELKSLQDRVPALGFEEIKAQIEAELGRPLDECFKTFQEKPLAAASIGQVHRATTADGHECVVKIQRPGIREKIQSDLDLGYYIARFLEATIQEVELYTPTAIVKEFEKAILAELDFTQEARSLREFRENFREVEGVSAPDVFPELSSERILTMEFIDAQSLSELESGSDEAKDVLKKLLDAMVKMVMHDGFFHGDPHPGNILVDKEGELYFIDFGLVGRLSASQQDDIIVLIISVLSGDVEGITRVLLRMGVPVGRVSLRAFKADVVRIRDTYLVSNLSDIDVSAFVREVMEAATRHRIRLNPTYAVLTKAAATIEGIMRFLEPDLDIMAIGVPYARDLARRRLTARRLAQSAINSSIGLSGFLTQIPQQLDQILMDLEGGNLQIAFQSQPLDELGKHLNTLGTRLFLGIIAAGLSICAAIVLAPHDVRIYGVSVMLMLGVLCAGLATLFFWWALSWHVVGGSSTSKLKLGPIVRLLRRE